VITIHREYCLHEEGTKFYQVWTIFGSRTGFALDGELICTITQWGKGSGGLPNRKLPDGQHKIFRDEDEANHVRFGIIREKKKRGYKDWIGTTNEVNRSVLLNPREFIENSVLGVSPAKAIELLGDLWWETYLPISGSHTVEVEVETEPKHEEWGTW
jgi:predicted DNA-binding WGR domain protein